MTILPTKDDIEQAPGGIDGGSAFMSEGWGGGRIDGGTQV